MDDDEPIITERRIPAFPVGVTYHVDFHRAFADVGDLISWFSLIIEEAPQEEHWVLNRIRREFVGMTTANGGN